MKKLTTSLLVLVVTSSVAVANAQQKKDTLKTNEIEGVVVTALGIKRDKKSLGYSSQQLKGDEISEVPTTNFLNNLSGKVAGLDIKAGTNFGGSTNIVLRGYKSMLGDNQALFVIDGVPILNNNINSASQTTGGGGYDLGNAAADINPDDIESLNVLKGAAATALYGSRAQNGAIVITTKKGKRNKALGIDFSSSVTISSIDKSTFPTYQKEYGQGYNGESWSGEYKGLNTANFRDDASYGPKFDPNLKVYQYGAFIPGSRNYDMATPWVAAKNGPLEFFDVGTSYNNNFSLNGGSDVATYRFSYGNTYSTDIMPNTSLSKNNFSGNASYKFNDKLTGTFSTIFVTQNTKGRNYTGYSGNIVSGFRQWWPVNVDLKDQQYLYGLSHQNFTWNIKSPSDTSPAYWNNPYFQAYENFETDKRNRLAINTSLSYDVTKDINLTARVSRDGYTLRVDERLANGSYPERFGLNGNVTQSSGYALTMYDVSEYNYDFLATYKKKLNDISINGLIGTNLNVQNFYSNRQSTGGGLLIPNVYTLSNSKGALPLPVTTDTSKKIFGAFAQLSLGYRDTYFLEGTIRRDQSTALPKSDNAYWYPSVSTSIVLSNLVQADWLTFGKFRAAYAQVGSDTDPNRLIDIYTAQNPFLTPMYAYNTTARNQSLKPQRLDNVEVGLNMQFLNNRLGFDVAWYQNKAFDQILALPVSMGSGSASQFKNAGTLRTRGFEVTVNLVPVKLQNFNWNIDVNWSNPFTKVVELASGVENISLGSSQGGFSVNAPLNKAYGTLWTNDYVYTQDGQRIVGPKGNYLISDATNKDQGSFQANWMGGIRNTVRYKNLSISFLIDIKHGGKVFSLDQYYGYGTGIYPDSVGMNDLGNPVRNTIANGGGVILPGVRETSPGSGVYIANDIRLDKSQSSQSLETDPPASAFIYKAGYVKLREAAITYKFPDSVLASTFLKGLSIGIVGQNLWIIHKDLPYADPEAGLSSGNYQGWQSGPMPTTRNISFSLKANF
ncbi:SusC/RagA family TonB-linked outer membrane protein [Chryseobacterium rhizosphaerae]|uniref:SusC/RagA family TonB-linked outer membrane protein n=1 Tax=Chryseobacterium rhizosphaerae TaxID=395937 RepID=UPI002359878C|nr:SusC/RagA family TonB-linked outer membrane protein [Chryseobacterium rhizosphaerae]MDC8098578.1 SusC/RagA family TonB-linked outer membrane protein [Chryseobacterium rhizosphaerae]